MAPESDARVRAFYDHESDEPRRRRRAAADWGVNEDIFDRMPSRVRPGRASPGAQEIVLRRDVDDASVAVIERDGGRFEREEVAAWTRETGARVSRCAERRPRGAARARPSRGSAASAPLGA